ncbi:hypothetical protein ACQKWADRAFT_143951 [Trichoderma austrokoningii]
MRYLCCHSGSSKSVTDIPILRIRICFAVKTKRIKGTRWKYQEYQIRFQDTFLWRYAFDHVPDTPQVECDGENLKSHWSLSTTQSNSSSGTARASGKSRFRNRTWTKKSLSSGSVQKMRHDSKFSDYSEQSRQLLSYGQSQEQHTADQSVEGTEEEKQRNRHDAYERLESGHDRQSREKHDSITSRFMSLFRSKPGREKSQRRRETPKHQGWDKLCKVIDSGLDAHARGLSALVTREQEAFLLPVKQKEHSFEVDMRNPGEARKIDDVGAAMREIEDRRWKDVVVFVRDGDTPWEQTEWKMMEEPRVLDWAPSSI